MSGLCITKLDVLDGVETLRLGIGYQSLGDNQEKKRSSILPFGAEELAGCEPIYEEMPGWTDSTVGIRTLAQLPQAARDYLKRMEEVCEVPVDMISTGPDREETIVLRHPFE